MGFNEILQRVAEMSPRPQGEMGVPEPEIIAFFVRMVRGLRQWKKPTLADFAGVSLSSIERIERGEKVSDETLDRVGLALGYDSGIFTKPRLPKTPEEVAESMVETYGHLEPVAVAPLQTQAQVRKLGGCHGFVLHGPEVPPELQAELTGLYEWLDLVSFVIGTPDSSEDCRRRVLYKDVLEHVRGLERNGFTVLAGILKTDEQGLGELKVAVITVTSKAADPAARKRKFVFLDRRLLRTPYSAME